MIGEWFGYTGSVTSIIMKSIITGIQEKSWEIREKKKKIEKTTIRDLLCNLKQNQF